MSLNTQLAQVIKENGLVDLEMVMENRVGQMGPIILEIGKTMQHKEVGNLYMQMETLIKASGSITKQMDMEYTNT